MHKKPKKTSTRPRPAQARGLKTRELLLDCALQSLIDNGIYGLRFAQIAKLAKVPQPLMDYHFPSLESLLSELIHRQIEKLKIRSLEGLQAHVTKPRKALEAYVRAPFEVAGEDAGFRAVWSCYYHLATVQKSFADFNLIVRHGGHDRIVALLVNVLHAEKKAQYLGKTKLLHEVGDCVQGIMTGFTFMAAAESDGPFKSLADLAVRSVNQLLAENFP